MTVSVHRHRRHAPPRDPLILGVLVIAGLCALFYFSLTHSVPFLGGGGRIVHAQFSTARQVTTKTPVRVRGVEVGKVESVDYDPARRVTDVAFRVDDDGVRLHRDASAALRWRSVLGGNMELALDPGSPSAPPLAGDRIAIARTRVQTELEDITHVFDGKGVGGQRALLQELPKALAGSAAGRAIDALPAIRPLGAGLRALQGEREGDLQKLTASAARAVQAIDAAQGGLGELVGGAQRTLRVVANDRAQLERTFQQAPAALDATIAVARAIDRTLPALDGVVGDLRPGARRLGPVLARTRPMLVRLSSVLRDARPLVTRLRPAVDRLATTSAAGRRLLAAFDPTLRRLAGDLVPYLEHPDDDLHLPVFQTIGPTFSTLAAAAAQYDDSGHVLNFPIQPAENSFPVVPCATFVSDPTATQKVRCDALNKALRSALGIKPRGRR